MCFCIGSGCVSQVAHIFQQLRHTKFNLKLYTYIKAKWQVTGDNNKELLFYTEVLTQHMKVMKTYHSSKEWPNHSNGLDITALCVMRNLKDKNATNLTLWFPNEAGFKEKSKKTLMFQQARPKLIWTYKGLFKPLCMGGWTIFANWIYANNITLHPNSSLKICRSWAKFSQNCQNMCEFGWNSTDFSLFAEGCLY